MLLVIISMEEKTCLIQLKFVQYTFDDTASTSHKHMYSNWMLDKKCTKNVHFEASDGDVCDGAPNLIRLPNCHQLAIILPTHVKLCTTL